MRSIPGFVPADIYVFDQCLLGFEVLLVYRNGQPSGTPGNAYSVSVSPTTLVILNVVVEDK